MTTPAAPSNPKPAGDDRNLVPVDVTSAMPFEDRLNELWQQNRTMVLGLCAAVLLVIVAKGGWEYLQRQKELGVQQAYAAATTTEQLKSFIAGHASHPLAGVAQIRIADDAYAAGKSADALAAYDQALAAIKTGPLAARAQLGRALAKVQAGKAADGTTDLTQLAGDTKQLTGIRAEATYHLASLAAETGKAVDVLKYVDQLMQLDPQSPWTQRALMLRATMPPAALAAAAAPAAPAAPAPAAKQDEPADGMKIKLPGK